MEAENLTNKDVAQIAKISEATVSRTLASRGTNATAATITAICSALGVSDEIASYEVIAPADKCARCGKCARCEARNQARIDDLKSSHDSTRGWLKFSVAFNVSLVVIFLFLLLYDILNPNAGWFRMAVHAAMLMQI